MRRAIHLSIYLSICLLILPLSCLPVQAQPGGGNLMKRYAERYSECRDDRSRLRLANEFFDYLLQIEYIDEPIHFPNGAHMDSVDLNVWYYIAEWNYGEGNFQSTIDYCTRATRTAKVVDDTSKSDVYALLGTALFRISAYDKAAEALNRCYELDRKTGDFDRMSSTLNNIASVFVAAGKPQEAEKYILEAIATNSLTDNITRRAVIFGTTSEIYRSTGDMKQSLVYARKALEIEEQLGDSAQMGKRLSQVAGAQIGLGKTSEAKQSLQQAIPLLLAAGNLHSWGICKNQMGDILASEERLDEATTCYQEAAMLFLSQGDGYNELHAREGLYKTMKLSDPAEAMLHLERAKQLQDSIYQHETGEALSKYNAIYYNDILEKEKEAAEQHSRFIVLAVSIAAILLVAVIGMLIAYTLRRHRLKVKSYEENVSTLEDKKTTLERQYKNVVSELTHIPDELSESDKAFVERLTEVIDDALEQGISDVDAIASSMNLSTATLRRRVYSTLATTPQSYVLRVRMHKAKMLLLKQLNTSITEVAERCGYSQMANFTRAFIRFYGMKPSEMRALKNYTNLSQQRQQPQKQQNNQPNSTLGQEPKKNTHDNPAPEGGAHS